MSQDTGLVQTQILVVVQYLGIIQVMFTVATSSNPRCERVLIRQRLGSTNHQHINFPNGPYSSDVSVHISILTCTGQQVPHLGMFNPTQP